MSQSSWATAESQRRIPSSRPGAVEKKAARNPLDSYSGVELAVRSEGHMDDYPVGSRTNRPRHAYQRTAVGGESRPREEER